MKNQSEYSHIFGPVMSRRLGRSLGIDLTPFKTCSLNCIYCECGPTTNLTIERKEFFPTQEVIEELKHFLVKGLDLDIITFSGSGEPTLHSGIGEIIRWIKSHTPYPVCVLTNGTLLHLTDVQEDLLPADIVIPSLDSAREESFIKINRPHPSLNLKKIIEGLVEFRTRFTGKLALEVFLLPGINDSEKDISALIEAIRRVRPDEVQLNTLDRPGAVPSLEPEALQRLEKIAGQIERETATPVVIVSRQAKRHPTTRAQVSPSLSGRILDILRRRPCDEQELIEALGVDGQAIINTLLQLKDQGLITTAQVGGRKVFKTICDT